MERDQTNRNRPPNRLRTRTQPVQLGPPPEIYQTEWIASLGNAACAKTHKLPKEVMTRYAGLLNQILAARNYPLTLETTPDVYVNAAQGWCFPWIMSSRSEKEAGMVFLLGKALYCIFEAVANTDIVLRRSHFGEQDQQFPQFHRTPLHLQTLIRKCTNGAREWLDDPIRIYRRGGRVFPMGKTGLHGEEEGSLAETQETITAFWKSEMVKAEAFVLARLRYDEGNATQEDVQMLHYLRRPSLAEVYCQLTATSEIGSTSL